MGRNVIDSRDAIFDNALGTAVQVIVKGPPQNRRRRMQWINVFNPDAAKKVTLNLGFSDGVTNVFVLEIDLDATQTFGGPLNSLLREPKESLIGQLSDVPAVGQGVGVEVIFLDFDQETSQPEGPGDLP